jgi:hypothetical protein
MKRMLVILFTVCSIITKAQLPEVYLFDPKQIDIVKQKTKQGDSVFLHAAKYITAEADRLLALKPGSVMDKAFMAPSKNKHDYMSLAPYFWPDPSKPDSLPYIRNDGHRNPMIDKITDKKNLVDLGHHTQILALAWALTGQEKYARKATDYLRTWFVDTATRMNPNLDYAQAVLGVNNGRGIGIIETIALTYVVDAVGLLSNTKSFTPADHAAITAWYNQYLNWMLTSKNGMDEHKALNNHGIWYDMQIMSFSLFLHKQAFAKDYALTILKRIPVQFEIDGRQPLELERTTALGYSTFSLEAWFKTAILAERVGVDIWHYQTADGRSIRKALDWLIPYATGEKKWTYQQIKEYSEIDKMYFLLIEAPKHYKDRPYTEEAQKLKANDLELIQLLYLK